MVRTSHSGFTLTGLVITIAILGILIALILTAIFKGRDKAYDNSVRNDVRQFRWLAEEVYNTQGARYWDWSTHPDVTDRVLILSKMSTKVWDLMQQTRTMLL